MTGTIATARSYVGRFAPSPTGPLHLGSLIAAVISYLDARAHDGRWLVRMEDIDPPREIAGSARSILHSLEAHALHWHGEVRFQRHSAALHEAALQQLGASGALYYCRCARRKLAKAGLLQRYPGLCREKSYGDGAVRVRVDEQPITVTDRWQAPLTVRLDESPGDFIVRRRDGLIAYQLAVVVDDADQGVTDIVRGVDLYGSTPRQCFLQQQLGLATPRYAHFPVLVGSDGEKLSKQTGAPAIDDTRAAENLHDVLRIIGLKPSAAAASRTPAEWLDWAESRYSERLFEGQKTHKTDFSND